MKSKKSKKRITSLAIGGFDGLHMGHQKLFKKLDKNGAILVIETQEANLTPKNYREFFTKLPIYYLNLSDIISLNPQEFLEFIEQEFQNLQKIVVGYDFKFGYNKSGDTQTLQKLYKGKVEIIKEVKVDGVSVHSRIIRGYIRVGDIKTANKLLGREYTIFGEVIKGQGIGTKHLYPTININPEKFLLPNEGVYATKTFINNHWFDSVSFIGHRVTTDGSFSVETHLINDNVNGIDFAGIKFLDKIRNNKMFSNLKDLKEEIKQDIIKARRMLK
jgi:riboflavin kinase/FMN adenylyltransferase